MRVEEIRIGNETLNGKVVAISSGDVILVHDGFQSWSSKDLVDGVEPIPLTEEWLLKFGFKKEWGKLYQIEANYFPVFMDDNVTWYYSADCYHYTGKALEYVHQLQNLYFTLTGEELKIES